MAGYTKQFLIDAFLWRYTDTLLKRSNYELEQYVEMVYNYYSEVGKDKFREAGSLDASELQKFRLATGQ